MYSPVPVRCPRSGSTALSKAAAASIAWAAENGVAFDQGKTEAALFRRKKKRSEAKVRVGDNEVPSNKHATRWLGVWLDS